MIRLFSNFAKIFIRPLGTQKFLSGTGHLLLVVGSGVALFCLIRSSIGRQLDLRLSYII